MKEINKAILGKWLWRNGEDLEGHWKIILCEKYQVDRGGWQVSSVMRNNSEFWKEVLSVEDASFSNIIYRAGRGIRSCSGRTAGFRASLFVLNFLIFCRLLFTRMF